MKTEYVFDVKLTAAVRVKAETKEQAEKILLEHFECADCNGGEWPDGQPVTFEASLDEIDPANSFEALRKALKEYMDRQEAEGDPAGLPEYEQAKAALALAEGEEWEVNPRWAENNQPFTRKKP